MKRLWPILRDYLMITAGAVLVAASVNMFLTPNDVVMGGLTGGAQRFGHGVADQRDAVHAVAGRMQVVRDAGGARSRSEFSTS